MMESIDACEEFWLATRTRRTNHQCNQCACGERADNIRELGRGSEGTDLTDKLQTEWRNYLSRRRFLSMIGRGTTCSLMARAVPSALQTTFSSESERSPHFDGIPASASGITWVHTAGLSPSKYLPETGGAGCAFLDYDNDGWMDIYLVNSGKCDFYTSQQPLRNALYHNNRDETFTDVTEKAGVVGDAYGMGVAVGDYDNDGFPDIYGAQDVQGILYHNNGDCTFTDVTSQAGRSTPGWSASGGWVDECNG